MKTEKPKKVAVNGKIFEGVVASAKNVKTIIVEVEHTVTHPLYKKSMKRSKRHAVHNEGEVPPVGAHVRIQEVKPISKTKHFILKEVIS